jgi:hypothetical protein
MQFSNVCKMSVWTVYHSLSSSCTFSWIMVGAFGRRSGESHLDNLFRGRNVVSPNGRFVRCEVRYHIRCFAFPLAFEQGIRFD